METLLIKNEQDLICFPRRHRPQPRAFTEKPGDTCLSTPGNPEVAQESTQETVNWREISCLHRKSLEEGI